MGVVGVSQGGALSMMTAGIDDRVNLLAYAHPAYCEHAGLPNDKASGFPFYVQSSRNTDGSTAHELATIAATRYYDAINFMKRYDGPSLGFIGYEDETSLASGIFAAYNGLSGESVLLHEIEIGHNPMPAEYWNGRYDFFRRHFPAMANPPFPYPDETTGYGIDAGADLSISAGTVLNLQGLVYDNDNANTSWPVQWELESGPGTVSFGNVNTHNTTATFSEEGTYRLRFSAVDDGLLSSNAKYYRLSDQMEVVVGTGGTTTLSLSCPSNINETLPSGASNISVTWNDPFPSGNCQSGGLSVSQTSGPANGSVLSAGTYSVSYQATDNCDNVSNCNFTINIEEGNVNPGTYCDAEAISPWFEWISAVNFEGINNFSSKEGYGDFTNLNATVNAGQSYPISITAGFSWMSDPVSVRVWIDYNNDFIFQETEEIAFSQNVPVAGSGGATSEVLNGTITIPADAVITSTRMRVALQRDAYANPCGNFQYGEVEDYTITINQVTTPTNLTINCPNDITVTAAQGSTSAIVNWSDPTTFSDCPAGNVSLTQTQGQSSGSNFPEGNTTITYEASDDCGNVETCSFTLTVILDNQPPPTDYCDSQGNTPWNEWISNVSLEQINNFSFKTTYSDFSDEEASLEQGGNYPLDVTTSFSWQSEDVYLRVWIDYNQNNIFEEPGEIVLSEFLDAGGGGATATLANGDIDVPADALIGNTRMRVAMKRGDYADPCETFAFGEVEDYGIVITDGNTNTGILTISCPSDISETIPAGQSEIAINWSLPSISTTCSGGNATFNQTAGASSGSSFSEGTYQIIYETSDDCGNVETCNFTITVNAETGPQDYCTSQGNTPWTEWLKQVNFQEIDNSSSKTQYSDFTDQIGNAEQGATVSLDIESGFSWQSYDTYLRVWIDYNQDGVFQEPAEIVLSDILYEGNGGATSVNSTADIDIPQDAATGQTRMRVALKRNAFADPCEAFAFGEVEDYTVNISETAVNYVLNLDCQQDISFNISQGSNTALVNWLEPNAATTCPGGNTQLNQTQGLAPGSFLPVGIYTIEYEVSDDCGNVETCSFVITVVDNNNNEPVPYCDAEGEMPWSEYIWKVRFGDINNVSFKDGYGDFTDQSTTVVLGEQHPISMQPKFSFQTWDEYFRVWVDWNQDGDFDDSGETVFSGIVDAVNNGGVAPKLEGLIEVPLYALIGETRMRISMQREAYAEPCGSFDFGEVEDYTLIVSETESGLEGSAGAFLYMTAGKENGVSKLDWDCNNADRTSLFEVEHSTNQVDFMKIKSVEVASDAVAASHFVDYDLKPRGGKNCYRIKQVLNNGTIRYSAIRELEYPLFEKEILLFPNPAQKEIYLQLSAYAGEAVSVEIHNTIGVKVGELKIDNCTSTPLRVDLSNYQNGMYNLSLTQESGKRQNKWFVLDRLD